LGLVVEVEQMVHVVLVAHVVLVVRVKLVEHVEHLVPRFVKVIYTFV
jgi:hypothetical protein